MTDELTHVHVTVEGVASHEFTPPHPPRVETPAYHKAHHFLIYEKKAPCASCGINIDTLTNTTINVLGSTQMETHHYPIERSLVDACDPLKVHRDFPVVYDTATLMVFVDSPANLIVLCDICHRSTARGIHHLLTQDWIIQRYLYTGYIVAGDAASTAASIAVDEHIEQTVANAVKKALEN